MKRLFFISAVLLSCLSAFADNPIKNPFVCSRLPCLSGYPHNSHEYAVFATRCNNYGDYDDKEIKKVKTGYEKLCNKQPETKYAAMCYLAFYYLRSDGIKLKYQDGFQLLKEGISYVSNDSIFQSDVQKSAWKCHLSFFHLLLGWAYIMGKGTDQDYDLAFYHFNQAKKFDREHNPKSELKISDCQLSYCYLLGLGTTIDVEKAKKIYYNYNHYNHLDTDIRYNEYVASWNKENEVDSTAIEDYRNGMILWLTRKDYKKAKTLFEKAIDAGYLPALCELGMMCLDEDWNLDDAEDKFVSYLLQAADLGYSPAYYLIGMRIFDHWGRKEPITSGYQGDAYPFFVASAVQGFPKAKSMLRSYDNGTYNKKTGFAATLSDMKGLLVDAMNSKELREGLVQAINTYKSIDAASSKKRSNSSVSTSRPISQSSSGNSSSSGGSSSDISSYVKSYEEYAEKGRKEAEKLAQEHLWLSQHRSLVADNIDFAASDWDVHLHMYNSHVHTLKTIKSALEERRQWAAEAGGNIPIGENERIVDAALAEDRPY